MQQLNTAKLAGTDAQLRETIKTGRLYSEVMSVMATLAAVDRTFFWSR